MVGGKARGGSVEEPGWAEPGWADEPLVAALRVIVDGADPSVIATALADGLLRDSGVVRLSGYFVSDGGDALEELLHYGPSRDSGPYARVQLDVASPLTEAFRTGESSAVTMSDAARDYPAVAGWLRAHPESGRDVLLASPIRARGKVLGVLLVEVGPGAARDWRLRSSLEAAQFALALWRLTAPGPASSPRPARLRSTGITARQRAIVSGLARGRTNAGIAADLGVSVGTVKADLAVLYRSFDVSDRQSLLAAMRRSRSSDPDRPAPAGRA